MRIIFVLLFICLLQQPATTQTPRPSQKEIQAQMMQAKTEAQKQIIDLENQIAEAKLKVEDPETIRDMESQLATMKKMMGVIDEASTAGNKRPKTLQPAKAEPEYISPFVPIPLKQPVVAPTKEQAKDQLLWYTGKKISANTLITISGMVVRYDRTNNWIIVQPDKRIDTPYYGLLNTLAQTSQMKNDFVAGRNGINNSFFMFPEIQKAYDEFNFFRDRYYDIGKNIINLPGFVPHQSLEVQHHHLIAYIATLPSPRNIILPPDRPNDLCACDPREHKLYESYLTGWLPAFCKEEMKLLNLLEAIYVNITAMGPQGSAFLTTIPNLKADIIKAFNLVIERLTQKLEELTNKYQPSNVSVEDGLVLVTKYFQKLLFQTFADMEEASTKSLKRDAHTRIEQIRSLVLSSTVFEKYVQDQKAALNFNTLFDYSLYESHELNKKILNQSNLVEENVSAWLESLDKFNRFVLSLKLDFEFEQIDVSTNDLLQTTNGKLESGYIIVSLARDDCSWHLFDPNVNHRDRNANEEKFQIPIKIIQGTKTIYEKKLPRVLSYSGPADMKMVFPTFKISFCPNATNDKALLDVLRYTDADQQKHQSDIEKVVYSIDLIQYANKMILGIKETQTNIDDLISTAGKMMNIQNTTQMPMSTGHQTLDKIKMDYVMQQRKRELQSSLPKTTHTGNTVIPFDAQNGFPILVSKTHSTVDPADKDKSWGLVLTKGLVTLKVEHSPLP